MQHIETCRTSELGGHLDVCLQCGDSRPSYNSCRDRHCPKCQSSQQARWIDARRARVLPVKHFHVVFTIPSELRPMARANGRVFYDLLFSSVSATLLELAADEKRLGAQPGITAVLHTWTRKLELHPHLHCIVTGGGLTNDARWMSVSGTYLFPVRVIGKLFRGKFMDGLESAWKAGRFSGQSVLSATGFARLRNKVFSKDWVVYAKQPFIGDEGIFKYLGRYITRVGISNQRLISIDGGSVRFITRGDNTATLPVDEFISRFMQHVLPPGFVKVRHFGLYAAGNVGQRLGVARDLIPADPRTIAARLHPTDLLAAMTALALDKRFLQRFRIFLLIGRDPLVCRHCDGDIISRPLPAPPPKLDSS